MRVGDGFNEYGTPISRHVCDTCGCEFTICPAVPLNGTYDYPDCLAFECASYDVTRDVDLMFEIEPWAIHRASNPTATTEEP